MKLHGFLVGPWLDGLTIDPSIKGTIRQVMSDHAAYRNLYSPHGDQTADVSVVLSWPPDGKAIIDLIERCSFRPYPGDHAILRLAHKLGKTPKETFEMKPWKDLV